MKGDKLSTLMTEFDAFKERHDNSFSQFKDEYDSFFLEIIEEYKSLRRLQDTFIYKALKTDLSDRRRRDALIGVEKIAKKLDNLVGVNLDDLQYKLSGNILTIYKRIKDNPNEIVDVSDVPDWGSYVSVLRNTHGLTINTIRGKGIVYVKDTSEK